MPVFSRLLSSPMRFPTCRLLFTSRAVLKSQTHLHLAQIRRQLTQQTGANAAKTKPTALKYVLRGGAVLVVVGGGSIALREFLYYKSWSSTPSAEVMVPEPPAVFEHPLDKTPVFWRTIFAAARLTYLFYLFVPVIAAGLCMQLTESERVRQFWLDMLGRAFEKAGCSFQKLGQWMSMRPDMFPPDVIDTLSKLRNDVAPHSYEHSRMMIRDSLGKELEELFEEFDHEPIASGTIAQVHRAVLKDEYATKGRDGKLIKEVAVKIRHPRVIDETWLDSELIFRVCNLSNTIALPMTRETFGDIVQKQVDLQWEAYNMIRFAENFKQEIANGSVFFPEIVTSVLSSSVLVETWVKGKSVANILDEVGEHFSQLGSKFSDSIRDKKKALAKTVFDINMKMFLRDNLMHGDLHAGNVMYSETGNTCTVLDAGLTTTIGLDIRPQFGSFLRSLCTGDVESIGDKLIAFSVPSTSSDYEGFRKDLEVIVVRWVVPGSTSAPDGGPVNLGDMTGEILFAMQRRRVALRGDVATAIGTMSISEGLIRSLDPTFDIVTHSIPYFVRFGGWANAKDVITGKF